METRSCRLELRNLLEIFINKNDINLQLHKQVPIQPQTAVKLSKVLDLWQIYYPHLLQCRLDTSTRNLKCMDECLEYCSIEDSEKYSKVLIKCLILPIFDNNKYLCTVFGLGLTYRLLCFSSLPK